LRWRGVGAGLEIPEESGSVFVMVKRFLVYESCRRLPSAGGFSNGRFAGVRFGIRGSFARGKRKIA